MYVAIIVFTVIVAILLIGIVLIQKSKGGGLSSQFSGANNVFGVRQANTLLEKITWTLAGLIVVLSVASAYTMPKASEGATIRTQTSAPAATPSNQFSTPAPAESAAPATKVITPTVETKVVTKETPAEAAPEAAPAEAE